MDSPLVSIVIPCHNAERWVADAIHSALAQTYTATEIIVVDDGSTDKSRQIIQSFGERVKLKFTDHQGAAQARNRGVEMASGEFVQFLDADDILFPHCVARKMERVLNENADVVYSGGFFFNLEANAGTYESHAPSTDDLAGLVAHIIRSSLVTSVLLCRRGPLLKIGGFDEELTNGQEQDLLLRLALTGAKFTYVPKALSCNRINHNVDSITSVAQQHPDRLEKLFCRFETMLKKADLWVPPVRVALGWRFHWVGTSYLHLGNTRRAVEMLKKAKRTEPKYVAELPFSRRVLVPALGGYTTEKLLTRLRQAAARFGNRYDAIELIGQTNRWVWWKLSGMHRKFLARYASTILSFPPKVQCNICHWRGRSFVSNAWHRQIICPSCGSQIRHRLLVEALKTVPDLRSDYLIKDKRILHFAPESFIQNLIEQNAAYYVTADFRGEYVQMQLDISNMKELVDGSFDVIIACDVLEHVVDDSVALREIHRVLNSNGWAILTVPQKDGLERTYEDPDIVTPTERKEAFGQEDHMRIYGADFSDRIRSHGFWVISVGEKDFDTEVAKKHVLFPPVPSKHPLATNYRKVFFAQRKDVA